MKLCLLAAALLAALLILSAFGLGYYIGATDAPPMTIVESLEVAE